ncbi:MAG: hypothetical protein ACTHU0_29910, partial [Kofleriaceae bacterium]
MSSGGAWGERNRVYLWAEIERVRDHLAGTTSAPTPWDDEREPAIVTLRRLFRLSSFEYDVVVLCAGHALEPTFAAAVEPPTFSFALARLAAGHLDASSATAALRLYRLVRLRGGGEVLHAPLSLDDRVVHFLLGIDSIDELLLPYLLPLPAQPGTPTAAQQRLADRIASGLRRAESGTVLQLTGAHPLTRLAVLRSAAETAGIHVLRLRASALALPPLELDNLRRTIEREMLLGRALPVIELDAFDGAEVARAARTFAIGISGLIAISADEPVPVPQASGMQFEVSHATAAERRDAWQRTLGARADALGPPLDRIAHQFRLDVSEIADVVRAADPEATGTQLAAQCWQLCRERSRHRIDDLARRIEPAAAWEDLV